jgi:1,4-dihydroxy-2-naphthoate octaprenyltransferase
LLRYLRAYVGVARLEYGPAEAPGLMVPLLLGATALTDFLRLQVLEGILVFGLLYISGFLVNSLMDIDVDIKYKTHISSSVSLMGRRTLFWLFIGHLVAASLLSIHIAFLMNDPWILALVVVGVVLGVGYSVRPMHFKVRGILHTLTLSISALFIPMLFLYVCMAGWPSVPILVLLIGFAILHYGIALANQSGDYLEDGDAGMRTPAVRWGLKRTLAIGLMMNAVGLCVMIMGILLRVYYIDTSIPYPFFLALLLVPFVLILGYYTPIKGMVDLYAISKLSPEDLGEDAEVERSNRIKKRMNYPKWQASGVYSLFTVSLLLFITVAYFPVTETTSEIPIIPTEPDYTAEDIQESDFGDSLAQDGETEVSIDIDINETHGMDDLYILST